jgi:hypothetical protein
LFFWIFWAVSFSALAAPVAEERLAGEPVLFPEKWRPMEESLLEERVRQAQSMLPVMQSAPEKISARGSVLADEDADTSQEILLLALPNSVFGLDARIFREMAQPGNRHLQELADGLQEMLARSGMRPNEISFQENGVWIVYDLSLPGGGWSGGLVEYQFTIDHVIVRFATATAPASVSGTDWIALPKLRVALEKHLKQPSIAKMVPPISSLFAIAGIVLASLILRRHRLQVLGKR